MYGFCTPFDDISRLFTVCHAASRCLRFMYAISLCQYTILRCLPPKCVNFRTAYEKVVDRSIFHSSLLTFPKFHLLCCSSVAPSLSSSSLSMLYRLFLQHGCGTITRTSNAVKGLAAAVDRALTNYYCETWSYGKREGKAKKKEAAKKHVIKRNSRFLICRRFGKEKAKQEKKKRSRYKDEIPDFVFRTCMSKVRNTGILSFYLAFSI